MSCKLGAIVIYTLIRDAKTNACLAVVHVCELSDTVHYSNSTSIISGICYGLLDVGVFFLKISSKLIKCCSKSINITSKLFKNLLN